MERLVSELTEKELREIIREEVSKLLAPTVTIPSYKGATLYEPIRPKKEPIFPLCKEEKC